MLSGLVILDFTTRLPGPLAASLLARRGARVIKIEDENYQDPFIKHEQLASDPSFAAWYESLNAKKEIVRFDFKGPKVVDKLRPYFDMASAVLAPESAIVKKLVSAFRPKVLVTLTASHGEKEVSTLHDLNVLALKKILRLHALQSAGEVIAPPFLPLAGICFGNALALDLVSALLRWQIDQRPVTITSSLEKAVDEQLLVFYPPSLQSSESQSFLHNGAYPCYNIYRTKDQHAVAFAPIENHLWERFCQIFKCTIPTGQRFTDGNRDPKLKEQLRDIFGKLTLSEVTEILARESDGHNLCITPFEL